MLLTEKHLQLPAWIRAMQASQMEKSLFRKPSAGFISFALGLPAVDLFPRELCQKIIHDLIDQEIMAFQYSPPTQELKSHIIKLMQLRGVVCVEEQILLTSGSQQGVNLLVRLLMEDGGKVILEELAYPGALQAIQPYSPNLFTVNTHPQTGIHVEAVEQILKNEKHIRFIYVVSEGGNPRAVSIEKNKRIYLTQLAERYGVPIIEDDPYGFINYNNPTPPLKQYSADWVFYVGSFSKIFAPSFRVGWLVVPTWLVPKLASIKECSDINTMTFSQHVVKRLLDANIFQSHLKIVKETYMNKRDCMAKALSKLLPIGAQFHIPNSGIFLWVDFPQHISTSAVLEKSLEQADVSFIPSGAFCATDKISIQNGIRLNFSHPSEQEITLGIERLGKIVNQFI